VGAGGKTCLVGIDGFMKPPWTHEFANLDVQLLGIWGDPDPNPGTKVRQPKTYFQNPQIQSSDKGVVQMF